MIFIILLCGAHSMWAQRASYGSESSTTNRSSQKVKLTENMSLESFVVLLKLDSIQEQEVKRILVRQKLRPTKSEYTDSPKALSYEGRRKLFEQELKAVLTEKQFARFKAMQ